MCELFLIIKYVNLVDTKKSEEYAISILHACKIQLFYLFPWAKRKGKLVIPWRFVHQENKQGKVSLKPGKCIESIIMNKAHRFVLNLKPFN